jgi:hypothetical protein
MKDAGMRIRVEVELREDFTRVCRDKDIPAARVLREFMKSFVANEGAVGKVALDRRASKQGENE